MNYRELSEKLEQVATRLGKQANKLEGPDLARAAKRLERESEKFLDLLEAFLASRKSGELMLETLLRSPPAKRHLQIDHLRKILRETTGKRLRAEDLVAARQELLEQVHQADAGGKAVRLLRDELADAPRIASGGKVRGALQEEFFRLGRLAEDEFQAEIASRTFGELRRLAEANGIRFTDKTSKQRLMVTIRRFAHRAAINVAV